MRIPVSCSECSLQIASGESGIFYSRMCSVRNDGVYEFECPYGHRTTTVLRTPKHEVLYTIGANAYLDGYLRDAIVSFAAALERYYEFAFRVVARHKKIKKDDLDRTWNVISKQSERQFGAFIAVWLMETHEPYSSFTLDKINKKASFRNDVVHNGRIPTLKECESYGQYVLDVVAPIERTLLTEYSSAHKDECFAQSRDVRKYVSPVTVLSIFSVFKAAQQDDCNLLTALDRLREDRKGRGFYIVGEEYHEGKFVSTLTER